MSKGIGGWATRWVPRRFAAAAVAAAVAAAGAWAPRAAAGQASENFDAERLAVPRFEIAPSPIELSGPVRPGEYFGVTGIRSAWLGVETGEAELWVHPLKVANGFRLAFSIPSYGAPIPGSSVAQTVQVRPEMATITYSHAAFQVRQHILAPPELPGLLVLLDVDSPEPLDIVADFEPVLNYMWPGSLGGQYAYWDQERRAFVLSESLQTRNAVVGSPRAANSVEHPAHQLGEAPRTMVIPVDPEVARREFIPIAIAAGTAPRDEVFADYERLISEAQAMYEAKRAWADSVLASTASVTTMDGELDLALEWAKINLEEQRVCNPDLGCGFVAGWGLSRNGFRPGFGWFFGGDAVMGTFAMNALGQWELVAEELAFLARHQRDDGKITHEISQSAAHIDWFGTYPYAYYHADTTPYWMLAVHEYWRASGDDALVRELWPAYRRAWEWCLSAETDGDGLLENSVGGLAAVEVGGLGAALHQDIYLAGVWTAALEGAIALAARMGDAEMERRARELAPLARRSLNDAFWVEARGHHGFGLLIDGSVNENLTVWPATAASFGLFDGERARGTLAHLASDRVSSDWGAHMLSTASELYHPLQYNMGTVWPFVTGYVAWGQYRYRRPWAGRHLVEALAQMAFDWSPGRHPELFSGTYYQPLDQTVPHQFFATAMLPTTTLRGMWGWSPDAPNGRARLAPQLPPEWRMGAEARGLRVGSTTVRAHARTEWSAAGGERQVELGADGPTITLDYVPDVPLGARDAEVRVAGIPVPYEPGGSVSMPLGAVEGEDGRAAAVEIVMRWEGGLAVGGPVALDDGAPDDAVLQGRIELAPGQRSVGLRILDFSHRDGEWTLEAEGVPGRAYALEMFGTPVSATVAAGPATARGGAPGERESGSTVVMIEFDEGTAGRARAAVRFTPLP